MQSSAFNTKKVALSTLLIALGVSISPMLWFPIMESKAFPGQHMINAVSAVLLGPWLAATIALLIGVIRMVLGWGTIFSIPGGVPGALVVGLSYWLLDRLTKKYRELAALTEPLGTIFIGGTLAVYLFAPLVGREMFLIPIWIGWAFSSIPGSILGLTVLGVLKAAGLSRTTFQ